MMNRERLMRGLDALGVAYDQTAMERFEAFHAILDEYNRRMDLTAVLSEDERVDRHDLDSAAPLAQGLLAQGARVIDVGTGAGFPGMPLLILRPDLQMTFLDALNKRIAFHAGLRRSSRHNTRRRKKRLVRVCNFFANSPISLSRMLLCPATRTDREKRDSLILLFDYFCNNA